MTFNIPLFNNISFHNGKALLDTCLGLNRPQARFHNVLQYKEEGHVWKFDIFVKSKQNVLIFLLLCISVMLLLA